MNYVPFSLFKCLSLFRALLKILLLPGRLIKKAYNLTVIWDVHPPKTHNTEEGFGFLFASWWRHSCYFVDGIQWDLMMPILPSYS